MVKPPLHGWLGHLRWMCAKQMPLSHYVYVNILIAVTGGTTSSERHPQAVICFRTFCGLAMEQCFSKIAPPPSFALSLLCSFLLLLVWLVASTVSPLRLPFSCCAQHKHNQRLRARSRQQWIGACCRRRRSYTSLRFTQFPWTWPEVWIFHSLIMEAIICVASRCIVLLI